MNVTSFTLQRNLNKVGGFQVSEGDELVGFGSQNTTGNAFLYNLKEKDFRKQLVRTFKNPYDTHYPTSIAFSKEFDIFVVGYSNLLINVYQLSTGNKLQTLRGHKGKGIHTICLDYPVSDEEEAKTCQLFSVAGNSNVVHQYDALSGQLIRKYEAHEKDITCMQFGYIFDRASDDDIAILVTGSLDATLNLWDVKEGKHLKTFKGHKNAILCFDFDQLGDDLVDVLVSGGQDKVIHVWNMETGELLRELKGHESSVECLSFDGSSELLASGSADFTVRVWNVETGDCLHVFNGHRELVKCITLATPYIFSGGFDSKIGVWNVEEKTGKILEYVHKGHVTHISILGAKIVSGSDDGTVAVHFLEAE